MIKLKIWVGTVALAATISLALTAPAMAGSASTTLHWFMQTVVKMTLTPNYYSGFGSVPAVFGTQPAPTYGPGATLDGGSVDFGSVLAGDDYLYRYAVNLNITTNSANGFNLYGEGAANFYNPSTGDNEPIDQTLYYLPSTSGISPDPNTGFSPATPFYQTMGTVSGGGQFTPASITYTTYPAPIATSVSASAEYYYDYQLKVPLAATNGLYYVWVVYTVVPQ
ncbi:MAG: hypothetical protein ACYDFS_07925 [Vulcanimicrobiaceae bacterium]